MGDPADDPKGGSGHEASDPEIGSLTEEENVSSTYYFNADVLQDMKEHMSSPQTRNREDKKSRQVRFVVVFLDKLFLEEKC